MIYKKKVLVVDENPDCESELKPILEGNRYQSLFVQNAADGLSLAADWQPHLVLVDLALSQMSGLGFLREIKRNSKTKNIPVLILSDVHDFEVIYGALELGAVGFVTKSTDQDELLSMMKECVPWQTKAISSQNKEALDLV